VGKIYEEIDGRLSQFIQSQHVYFVATAPLAVDGHVNLSPKGLDSLQVLGPRRVAYLDLVGSGAETIAHLRENERIVMMFCAFEGPPKIVRLHGRGRAVTPEDAEWKDLSGRFPTYRAARSIVVVEIDRISDSCGYGVPLYTFERERSQLTDWADCKSEEEIMQYQRENNVQSLDGLPALRPER
jgi:hypothetical protein